MYVNVCIYECVRAYVCACVWRYVSVNVFLGYFYLRTVFSLLSTKHYGSDCKMVYEQQESVCIGMNELVVCYKERAHRDLHLLRDSFVDYARGSWSRRVSHDTSVANVEGE